MAEYKGDRVGQQLGPYRLDRLLGVGGFGEVYEADHRLLQLKRAIKLLLERHFHDPNQRERFLREARTLATLEHPNILPVLEVGEEGNILYLVMPFFQRGTLNNLLKQRTTPLPLAEVERFLAQMCAAVDYAHAQNVAHLDLKPENILLHEDGRLVLSDFGLAHLIKQGRLEAGSSASWGTPHYMAPEQIRGEPELSSDLYALGIILYQLLTNKRPFTGNTPDAVMMKHLLEAPPPLHTASSVAPAALEPVMQKALAKKPKNRYPTAEALLADFRAAVGSSSPKTTQPTASGASPADSGPPMNNPTPVVQPTIRVPLNKTQATAAVCELEVGGQNCGVQAVGRCAFCKHAFCAAHQAWSGRTYYIDQCAPCFAAKEAEALQRWKEAQAPYEYIRSDAARTALLASGVPPVDIYKIRRKWKTGLFGDREVVVATSVRHGWILGTFKWASHGQPDGYSGDIVLGEDCLTALLDLSVDDPWYSDHWRTCGLVPVRPYSRGYEAWKDVFFKGNETTEDLDGWREVMQAVKRLIGESS